jgi:twitching motility protein PilU
MTIDELLAEMVAREASDGFVTARAAPSVKVDGEIYALGKDSIDESAARSLVLETMTPTQQAEFMRDQECNYAIHSDRFGRFRASAFIQRGQFGLVLRRIKSEIPRIPDLGLPPIVADLAMVQARPGDIRRRHGHREVNVPGGDGRAPQSQQPRDISSASRIRSNSSTITRAA